MFDQHVIFLDLETTGGSPMLDRIIEVGIVEVDRGRLVGEWSTLVNPGRGIPFGIQNLTGITDAMAAEAPRFNEIGAMLARRLDGKVLAAHNARFDYGFLKAELERAGLRYMAPVLCTVKLSRRLFPHHVRHNLDALIMRHSIFCLDRHRALGDARVLWELAQLWRREHGEAALNAHCAALLKRPAVPAGLPLDVFDTIPETRGVYVFYGDGDLALHVGRSANLRARIMAHFSDGKTSQDARIADEIKRIDWLDTAGELGASLHEARLTQTLAPRYNRQSAHAATHYTWRWHAATPEIAPELVTLDTLGEIDCDTVYGFFRSRSSARQALRGLAKAHGLCRSLIGLEPSPASGGCSARAANECRGACVGAESPIAHAMRAVQALGALRMKRWPYSGPVGIRERVSGGDRSELHLVDRWCYLGSAKTEADLHELAEASRRAVFHPDTYKMLVRFLKYPGASCDILPLKTLTRSTEELT